MTGWTTSGLALALAAASVISAFAEDADVAEGRKLALEVCATCHIVAPDQERPPVLSPPAPSFADIASSPEVTAASLERFLAEPHSGSRSDSSMPPFLLPPSQVGAAIAYLLSLKPR